jgi:hypothetical protein
MKNYGPSFSRCTNLYEKSDVDTIFAVTHAVFANTQTQIILRIIHEHKRASRFQL